jgi:rare lipoprotein A
MTASRTATLALLCLCVAAPAMAADCLAPAALQPVTGMSTVAPEMVRAPAVDPFCLSAADAVARLRAPDVASSAPGAYVPLTKDDNTPWRFDMQQNGRQMTSAEFDTWMKAKGIRVATGKPGTNAAAVPASTAGGAAGVAAPSGATP